LQLYRCVINSELSRSEVPQTTGLAAEVAAQIHILDTAVEEVFSMMMGISCKPIENLAPPTNEVTAVVGLAGSLSGAYVINVSNGGAMRIAGALMGTPATEVDDMLQD
jgi:chemotaxis protein CheX